MAELVSSVIDGQTVIEVGGKLQLNVGTGPNTVLAGDDPRLAVAATAVQPGALAYLIQVAVLNALHPVILTD